MCNKLDNRSMIYCHEAGEFHIYYLFSVLLWFSFGFFICGAGKRPLNSFGQINSHMRLYRNNKEIENNCRCSSVRRNGGNTRTVSDRGWRNRVLPRLLEKEGKVKTAKCLSITLLTLL